MDYGLEEKTALVLAAGGGLGGAIASALAAEGVRIGAVDRDGDAVERTAEQIKADGGSCVAETWDLAETSILDRRLDEFRGDLGEIDVLVNVTGGPPATVAAGADLDEWRAQFEAMVASVIRLTDLVLPGMRERRWGRIITSTSSGVVAPIPNLAISNALRLSLVGWSKTLAAEVAEDGVTVNIVVPGRIATGRVAQLDAARAEREGRTREDVERASTASIPMRRYGRPEEYAKAVCFLASDGASYITGSTLRVDGGLIASV